MRRLKALPGVALALFMFACSEDGTGPTAASAACSTSPAPEDELAVLPDDLPLDEFGSVIQASERQGFVGAEVITETTIVELYPELSRLISENGFQTISGENEGFEAEIFFTKGKNTGSLLLREGPCKGQITIKLLYGAAPGAAVPTPPSPTGGKQ